MTDQQTRTLADYPVGSRWKTEDGHTLYVSGTSGGLVYASYSEGRLGGPFVPSVAATWTRIDEPAPYGLREAAEGVIAASVLQPNGSVLVESDAMRKLSTALIPTALAQPAPASESTPPASDERRWQAALAALTGLLAHYGNEGADEAARYAVQHADALLAAMEAGRG